MAVSTEAVWKAMSGDLRAYISRRVRAPHDVDDILQTVFLKIHDNLSTLRDWGRLEAWIYGIARRAIVDFYRGRTEYVPLDDVPEPAADERDGEGGGASGCIKPMLDALPDKYKEALTLTEMQGLSQRELAHRTGLSFSGAKSRVQRGRELLREVLLECCTFEFDRRGGIVHYEPRERERCECD